MLQIKNKELAWSIQVIRQSDDEVGERQSTLQLNQIKSFPFDSSIVYNCGLLTLALDLANCWLFWQKPIYRPTPFLIKNRGIGLYRADLIMKTFHMHNNYRLMTAYLLSRVNLDKTMHARWDFDASSARTRRVSALDKHQNWSASALFCLNSRAQSKYTVVNLIHTRRKQTFLSFIMW